MPQGVLELFWEEIFLPAISRHVKDSRTSYIDQSLTEIKYKSTRTGEDGRGGYKILPLSNSVFLETQWSMHEIIQDNYDLLSMYGSFFFVVEGKGIKLLTKNGQDGVHESLKAALHCNISCLDWNIMLNCKKEEMVISIEVSFTS